MKLENFFFELKINFSSKILNIPLYLHERVDVAFTFCFHRSYHTLIKTI